MAEWQERAQAMASKRSAIEREDKSKNTNQQTIDFRNVLRKVPSSANTAQSINQSGSQKSPHTSSSSYNITSSPSPKPNYSIPSKSSSNSNSFGKKASQPPVKTIAPSKSTQEVPDWKIRLEQRKLEAASNPKEESSNKELPENLRSLKQKYEDEKERRILLQNKLQSVLEKIQEAKENYTSAMNIFNLAEKIIIDELKDQTSKDNLEFLSKEEREKIKEDEWNDFINDIEKRKKKEKPTEEFKPEKEKEEKEKEKERTEVGTDKTNELVKQLSSGSVSNDANGDDKKKKKEKKEKKEKKKKTEETEEKEEKVNE